jgi:glucosamine--fructose-6-phosphate aminotransferase (isomerizing)
MPANLCEQLLQTSPARFVDLALAGLQRQEKMLPQVMENTRRQLVDIIGLADFERVYLVGCGDAYFPAQCASYAFGQLAGLPAVVLRPEEVSGSRQPLPADSLILVICGDKEITVALDACRAARQAGAGVIGITQSGELPLDPEFPCVRITPGSPEHGPVDKATLTLGSFNFVLATLYQVAICVGRQRGQLDEEGRERTRAETAALPDVIRQAAKCSVRALTGYVERLNGGARFYVLGSGPSRGVALYYQAMLSRHVRSHVYTPRLDDLIGHQLPLASEDGNVQVWFIMPPSHQREQTLEAMDVCRRMGTNVVAVTTWREGRLREAADMALPLETTSELFSPFATVVPGQLLSVFACNHWGNGALRERPSA